MTMKTQATMTIRGAIMFVPAILAVTLYADAAFAHAQLVRAVPAAGATVGSAPSEVTLRFNERLEPAFSSVTVRDAGGKQVDKGDTHVEKSDRAVMKISLPPLSPGVYTVEWRATSSDTHKVNGTFTFKVGE
jgi:methionine-rich copper-binding protein CopC